MACTFGKMKRQGGGSMADDERRREAEAMYIAGSMSLRALAEQTKIPFNTIKNWSREDKWPDKRKKVTKRARKKAVTRAVNQKAKELAKLMAASDEIEKALLTAARAINRNMTKDKSGMLVTDGKWRAGNLAGVVNALGRQTETRRMMREMLEEREEGSGWRIQMGADIRELSE